MTQKKLEIGEIAPDFKLLNILEKEISLSELRGKKVWLAFYRYTGCPACNLHIQKVQKNFHNWEGQITKLAIFQTPLNKMQQDLVAGDFSFHFLSDQSERIYDLYSTHKSWMALFNPTIMPTLLNSMMSGNLPSSPDGSINRMPAEFLISEEGIIQDVHYGQTIADHLEFKRIDRFIRGECAK